MSGDEVSGTFKRCRSAIDLADPVLRKIAREINLAESLLSAYLEEVSRGSGRAGVSSSQEAALDQLSRLVSREMDYLRKVKASRVVAVSGGLVTFRSDDGEFLVTLVPEEELQKNFKPLFCMGNNPVKPRFAKPPVAGGNFAAPSPSGESVYYDACHDLPGCDLAECDLADSPSPDPSNPSSIGNSIYGLLKYIFANTVGKLEGENP